MALTPGQQKCIETLNQSLVVAAGAGSGKTFTLTKRIVHAISSRVVDGIDRVCAITFTNKAAGELKARVKAELRACGMTDQALAVDEAWVSTIHGMCARILRAHAIELDLDPQFKMIDPADASVMRARAVDAVLRLAQAADSGFQREAGVSQQAVVSLFEEYPARSYGPRSTSVESMLGTIMGLAGSNPRGFDSLVIEHSHVNPARLVDIVAQTYEALVDATGTQKPTQVRDAWVAETSEQLDFIRSEMQEHASDMQWALHALDGLPLPKRVGTADYKAQVSEAITLYQTCVMELRLALAAPHLETLVALARAAHKAYARAKRDAGVLDNDDLLVGAFNAVSTHPDIARLYADKFQLVMVDEFQDTDQMQVDMIKMIAGPAACRLCTVGDAQQSIYRFRGADVSVYRKHLEEVRRADHEGVIQLPDNFRSHPDVLSLVDRVFERPEMFGGEFMSLSPGRDEESVKRPFAAGVPRIQVQLTSNSVKGASSDFVREVAAGRIADAFADLHDKGHSMGEMAVLLGRMAYAGTYAAALRARGLACVISGGSVFSTTPEAQLVRDLTNVAANVGQTQALHNVLISDMFGLTAGDLLELSTYVGGDGRFRRGDLAHGLESAVRTLQEEGPLAAWSPQLVLAVRVMGDFVAGSKRSHVSRAIMRAVVDSGLLTRLQNDGPEGLARAANVYKAIRIVRDIEQASASGPARVASVFQTMLDESKEAPGALSTAGGDFVRIMTVHASKGLEFPIVAVAEFGDASGPSGKLLAGEVNGHTYLSLDLGNTVSTLAAANLKSLPELYASMVEGYDDEDALTQAVAHADGALTRRAALYERERIGDEEEAKRLLYVALTRAKEALVISCIGKRTKDNPNATPKSCLGAVLDALADEEGLATGISQLDFRGSMPAKAHHVALEAEDEQQAQKGTIVDGACSATAQSAGEAADDGNGHGQESGADATFIVPAPESLPRIHRVPCAHAHEGVFSYSSVSDAAHKGDLLERLAARFFVAADAEPDEPSVPDVLDQGGAEEPSSVDLSGQSGEVADERFPRRSLSESHEAAVIDEDDGSWAYVGSPTADSDKATDLGTAFHRLAQHAVVVRKAGQLSRPPQARIDALARTCNLDGMQRERLNQALGRWFASDIAAEMSGFAQLSAEVPFFVEVPMAAEATSAALGLPPSIADGSSTFLEGEIDLLALDDQAQHATVVDYKTGGNDAETVGDLSRKHVLQATCYAYAIMLQGTASVDAVFVRVERPRPADSSQPQCVRYHFDAQDMPVLAEAIAEAYALGH